LRNRRKYISVEKIIYLCILCQCIAVTSGAYNKSDFRSLSKGGFTLPLQKAVTLMPTDTISILPYSPKKERWSGKWVGNMITVFESDPYYITFMFTPDNSTDSISGVFTIGQSDHKELRRNRLVDIDQWSQTYGMKGTVFNDSIYVSVDTVYTPEKRKPKITHHYRFFAKCIKLGEGHHVYAFLQGTFIDSALTGPRPYYGTFLVKKF
jgi:hypothetical protein